MRLKALFAVPVVVVAAALAPPASAGPELTAHCTFAGYFFGDEVLHLEVAGAAVAAGATRTDVRCVLRTFIGQTVVLDVDESCQATACAVTGSTTSAVVPHEVCVTAYAEFVAGGSATYGPSCDVLLA